MRSRKKSWYPTKISKTDLLVFFIFFSVFVLSMLFVRPMQDDYVSLRDVSNDGLLNSIHNMWKSWGGNISTIVISNFFINLYASGFIFYGIALHSIIVTLLLLSTFRIFKIYLEEITGTEIGFRSSSYLILSFFCFGSLHAPGYFSILNFTLAATAHLLPTLIFVHAIYFARSKRIFSLFSLFILGFIIGNLNISESIFCLVTSLIIRILIKSSLMNALQIKKRNLLLLIFGQIIGLLTIVLAPGFRVRSEIVLEPHTFQELVFNFFLALLYNVGDILLHPGWFLALLVGCVFEKNLMPRFLLLKYLKITSFVLVLCVLTVSAGGAFAYPSWYHTMSFYVFVFPVFFTLGLILREQLGVARREKFLILRNFVFVFCLLLLVRDMAMMGVRAEHWDRDYESNKVRIANNQFNLVGYNVNYWPLGLGVDDVEKWAWIKSAYIEWVQKGFL